MFIYLSAPGLSCGIRILILWLMDRTRLPALSVQILNNWTTRVIPRKVF